MLRHLINWGCVFLITFVILGCNNQKIKEETVILPEPVSDVQIQKEDVKKVINSQTADVKQQEGETKQQENQEKISPLIPQEPEIEEIKWYKSFEEGLKAAKEEKKPLMVDFEADWCIWCKRLDETTYKNSQVIALSKKFIPVKVNCDTDKDTAHKYKVTGLPTIIFMNTEGQEIHRVIGYRGPEDFVLEMKRVEM